MRRPVILICEDEEPLRRLIRAALALRDYEVVEARDGDEAVQLAQSARPDVIVLDLMMPGRTGLEVLEAIGGEGGPDARIVMLTARAQASDREAAAAAGVDRFVAKPFSPHELNRVVAELLEV